MDARITSIVPTGSGAVRFHHELAALLRGYNVLTYPPSLERTPWRLRRLRPRNTDVVHTSPDHAIWVAPPNTPLIASFLNYVLDPEMRAHSTLAQRLHYRTDLRLFTRLAVRRAAAVTAVSHATAQLVRDDLDYTGAIHVIVNSVDSTLFRPRKASERVKKRRVLFCATPSRRKGFHWLSAIAKGIRDLAELACATGGRVTPAGDRGCLNLLGAVPPDALPQLYRSASVFVLPSVREGMSLALLEAMATGLPVVAWRVPSSVELLGDMQLDFLPELGDVDGFVECVRYLLRNPELALKLGTRNRNLMLSSHQPSAMAAAYSALFGQYSSR